MRRAVTHEWLQELGFMDTKRNDNEKSTQAPPRRTAWPDWSTNHLHRPVPRTLVDSFGDNWSQLLLDFSQKYPNFGRFNAQGNNQFACNDLDDDTTKPITYTPTSWQPTTTQHQTSTPTCLSIAQENWQQRISPTTLDFHTAREHLSNTQPRDVNKLTGANIQGEIIPVNRMVDLDNCSPSPKLSTDVSDNCTDDGSLQDTSTESNDSGWSEGHDIVRNSTSSKSFEGTLDEEEDSDQKVIIPKAHRWYRRVKKLKRLGGASKSVYLGNSRIHGKGIFVKRFIRKDKIIMLHTGKVLNQKEQKHRAVAGHTENFANFMDGKVIDGEGMTKFINHSCRPNAILELLSFVGGTSIIVVSTLRNIRKGQELTCDYGWNDPANPIPCKCGVSRCREFMTIPK